MFENFKKENESIDNINIYENKNSKLYKIFSLFINEKINFSIN